LNLGPPEQEAGVLTTHLWSLVEAVSMREYQQYR
jgi:hypothetical protein